MKPIIPEAALQQHIAVLGKTRSGKSSVLRGLVEGLLDREQPVCIVDPKGDWWGIKLARDGKRPGYPVVIFGGEHADVPLNAHAGAHVAELFATGNRPCLIDLGGWMVGERTRFWIEFASTLFRHTRGTRWLVIDEIHNFAPKGKVLDPDSGKALHWANRLASEGLGKGLPMLFASQRPQKVHNDTLTSAETLIAMRVLHPSDRGAVSDWIKGCGDLELGAKVLASLAQMDRGEGWVWSPEIGLGPERVKFPLFKTYDSFRPQSAEDAKSLKGWAEVDLEEVKTRLAAVVQEAEANDPRRLHLEISRLRQKLAELERAGTSPPVDRAALAGEYARGLQEGTRDGAARTLGRLRPLVRSAHEALAQLHAAFDISESPRGAISAAPSKASPGESPGPRSTAQLSGGLPKGERLILSALAQYPDGRSRTQVAILTGYSSRGGGFGNALGALRSAGRILGDNERLQITPAGHDALGSYEPLPQGKALLEHWLRRLSKAERKALEALAEVYPRTLSKLQIATRAGYQHDGGGFINALGKLRTLELIEGRGEMKASDALFDR